MPFTIDASQLRKFEARVRELSKNSKRDLGRVMVSITRGVKTDASRAITARYTIGTRRALEGLTAADVDKEALTFRLIGSRKALQLQEFKHTASRRSGVAVQVIAGGSLKSLRSAFKATAKGFGGTEAKPRIFVRKGRKRLPILALPGPSVGGMLANKDVQQAVAEKVIDRGEKAFESMVASLERGSL